MELQGPKQDPALSKFLLLTEPAARSAGTVFCSPVLRVCPLIGRKPQRFVAYVLTNLKFDFDIYRETADWCHQPCKTLWIAHKQCN